MSEHLDNYLNTLPRNIFPDFKDSSITTTSINNPLRKDVSTANPPPPIQQDSLSVSSTESSKSSSSDVPTTTANRLKKLKKSYNQGAYKSNIRHVFLHPPPNQTYNSNSNSEHGYTKAVKQRRTTRKKRPGAKR